MKFMNSRVIRSTKAILAALAAVVFLLAFVLMAPASQAQQATDTPSPTPSSTVTRPPAPGPLTVSSIQPSTVPNDRDVEIVVTGGGFVNGSVVILSNYGGLETTYVSASVLRATVVAGISTGQYDVQVVNPDAATAVLPGALTVVVPAGFTATPEPSATPAPTAFVRPLLVVQSYGASSAQVTPGQNLDFEMTLVNAGQATASNILATFVSGDFVPRDTGGVRAVGTLTPGQPARFWQPLFATADLRGKATAILKVTTTYTDVNGQSYESSFDLSFPVVPQGGGGAAATATPTATATITPTASPRPRPQLLVSAYETDPDPLEPGQRFTLTLEVENQGEANARNVSLVLGGSDAGSISGTPESGGGVSGGGGQFGEFAPIGSSNVSRLGELAVGESREASQQLIVNTSTEPGAYPVRVSFVYNDNTGASFVDDQVITLLVLQRPQVEMGFYTTAPTLFAGEPGSLPLQVVNTGRNSVVFGNFSVAAPNSELTNNAIFVGALEPGGFFPLDALITPFEPGPLELTLSINYTNDFNQPDVITNTLTVEVLESIPVEPVDPGLDPGSGVEGEVPAEGNGSNESLGQRIWRFILGLFGLGSAPAGDEQPVEGFPVEEVPVEEFPIEEAPVEAPVEP